jgi:hypothetical protein
VIQNVHEGPMGIGTRLQYSEVGLNAGNVLSDGKARATPSSSPQLTIRTRILRGWQLRYQNREHDHGPRNVDKPQIRRQTMAWV